MPRKPDQVFEALWPVWTERILDRAFCATELVEDLIKALGPIGRREDELRAGDRVLNDDRDILLRVSRASSLGLSLYLGNRRVASASVIDAGSSGAVGGFAAAELVDTVLRRQDTFRGQLNQNGRQQLVVCRPLYSSKGTSDAYGAVGMIEAYQDLESYQELVRTGLARSAASRSDTTEEQTERMDSVIRFIDDVARRLQLLALNGNIIAAQAGDHGRAFRVVCRELSSLAEQSKDAVAQVRLLMDELLPPDQEPEDEGPL